MGGFIQASGDGDASPDVALEIVLCSSCSERWSPGTSMAASFPDPSLPGKGSFVT
jgi:hypothetical protein